MAWIAHTQTHTSKISSIHTNNWNFNEFKLDIPSHWICVTGIINWIEKVFHSLDPFPWLFEPHIYIYAQSHKHIHILDSIWYCVCCLVPLFPCATRFFSLLSLVLVCVYIYAACFSNLLDFWWIIKQERTRKAFVHRHFYLSRSPYSI